MKSHTIGIIGLGLIGGSLAALIHEHDENTRIFAIDPDPKTLTFAKEKNWINTGYTSLSDCTETPTILFICTPLSHITETIITASKHFKNQPLIITDVGSVKTPFTIPKNTLSENHTFIPGHPMAGKETTGILHAEASLLINATYFLIQDTENTSTTLTQFLKKLTFNIIETTAEKHDALMSSASHIPYIMSCLTVANGMNNPHLQTGISSGFKDTTRIAESNPEWGQNILLMNQKNILSDLENLEEKIKTLKHWIQEKNTPELTTFLSKISRFRMELYSKR
jgi:prephenate dehydrogenase